MKCCVCGEEKDSTECLQKCEKIEQCRNAAATRSDRYGTCAVPQSYGQRMSLGFEMIGLSEDE